MKIRGLPASEREDYETHCDCGAVIYARRDGKFVNETTKGRCDWDNCTTLHCPECGVEVGKYSVGSAGFPDCPCDGRKVSNLRWPWTSERFVDAYSSYHMWAFGIRVSDAWWHHLLKPIPYVLFGNFTGAQYRHVRLYNPEYFERKRGGE